MCLTKCAHGLVGAGEIGGRPAMRFPTTRFNTESSARKTSDTVDFVLVGKVAIGAEVAARQRPFLELIKSRPDDNTILVCMHGRAMRILLCQMLHYPLLSMDMFEHENLGLYLLNYTGTQFIVELHNNTDHLKGLEVVVGIL